MDAAARPAERSVSERIADQNRRIHINTGAVCNNNCIFCMEEDREARYWQNSQMTPEVVREVLDGNRGSEEVCFTSGEPTTNERLPEYVRWARERGYRRISIMTNGRMLSQLAYSQRLLASGMNRFYISIHGHDAKLHDGLTRTPGSFDQTVRGIDMIKAVARAARRPIDLHTSTVITRRNLPHLPEIYRFLRAHGVDQVVFNVMQANGRANTFFEQIFPPYAEIAALFRRFIAEAEETTRGENVMAFLVDIPLCTTEGIPDFNRGYVEAHTHYGSIEEANQLFGALIPEGRLVAGGKVVELTRADLDHARRQWRAECDACKYRAVCEGVWGNYLARLGWDEFVPVTG
ncbi:MAG: radical SAM protein [Myxococcales bacterium]|nr:radical SAM protein [Myxococcales bacterium]